MHDQDVCPLDIASEILVVALRQLPYTFPALQFFIDRSWFLQER